jgi:hypothetical protein
VGAAAFWYGARARAGCRCAPSANVHHMRAGHDVVIADCKPDPGRIGESSPVSGLQISLSQLQALRLSLPMRHAAPAVARRVCVMVPGSCQILTARAKLTILPTDIPAQRLGLRTPPAENSHHDQVEQSKGQKPQSIPNLKRCGADCRQLHRASGQYSLRSSGKSRDNRAIL